VLTLVPAAFQSGRKSSEIMLQTSMWERILCSRPKAAVQKAVV